MSQFNNSGNWNMAEISKLSKANKKRKNADELRSDFKSEELLSSISGNGYLDIQLLICYYMGIIDSLVTLTNINKSKFLKILFAKQGAENIRKKLSGSNQVNEAIMTDENLIAVFDFFNELGLSEIASMVEKDRIRLNSRK